MNFPQYAVLAGTVRGQNNGGHGGRPLVNSTGLASGSRVRCTPPPQSANCIDLNPERRARSCSRRPNYQPQLRRTSPRSATTDALQALEDVARANGTYYARLPGEPERRRRRHRERAGCAYNNSAPAAPGQSKCCNSAANPGLLVIKQRQRRTSAATSSSGASSTTRTSTTRATQNMVETSGTSAIRGGALVDGNGGVYAGSRGRQHHLLRHGVRRTSSAVGTAGVVQNTWREIVSRPTSSQPPATR